MGIIPTVEVVHEDGFCIINESDFDSKVHTRYKQGKGAAADPSSEPAAGSEFIAKVVDVRVAEAVQLISESEDRVALEQLAETAERKTIRRAASRRLGQFVTNAD